jgi:predicted 3-demethylubiquinone-9 3-methyltransferase (glyoxalase superfamily)
MHGRNFRAGVGTDGPQKKLHSAAVKMILKDMQSMAISGRPRRKLNLAYYSSKYYATRMKAKFDVLWAEAKKTLASSNRLSMCQDYVNSCWEKESEEFKQEMIMEADDEHAEAMRKYKEKREIPERTAESYHE